MDLRSGAAFWPLKNGLMGVYPALTADVTCDVVVVGGGITGALAAYHLVEAGLDTVVLDKRDVGGGSTSASTALLQYEVDTPLAELSALVGKANAERSYLMCLDAIVKLEALAERLKLDCDFKRKKSLYLASTRKDVAGLKQEYELRRALGIELDFLSTADIRERFSFGAPAALLSDVAAQVDPYRLTMGLLDAACAKGLRVFDRTTVTDFDTTARSVTLTTERRVKVRAKHIVMASGYEAQQVLKQKIVTFENTYAAISEPVADFTGWGEGQCLIWETARPYFYARTTADGRILFGGEDRAYESDEKRDRRIPAKTRKLVKRVNKLFPDIPVDVAYAWAGVFGGTEDGLPVIGQTPEFPRAFFALGYGGNGITYSLIAAELIRDALTGRANKDGRIFGFERLS